MRLRIANPALTAALVRSRPERAVVLAWPYVALQGYVYGALSREFEARAPGVVRDALIACVVGGLAAVDAFTFVAGLCGADLPWLHEGSRWAIALSLYAVVAAAFNFVGDFDRIEAAITAGTPRAFEWYAAFGLLVGLVWLYVEVLRLLFHLRRRKKRAT